MTARKLQLLLAMAFGVVSAGYSYSIYSIFERRWNYLTWDPAAHGWDGMRLAIDVRNLDIVRLVLDTNQLVLWPPLHSYLQVPYFFLFGFEFHSAVLCSLTFLALVPVALTWLYQQMEPTWSGWLVLMVLAATSPLFLGYGSMPMLEIFGATLTAWSAALYLRRSYWFPLSLALLFFLKYNYLAYLLLGLLAAVRSFPNFRANETFQSLKILVWIAALFAVAALAILITGGFQIGPVSVHGIGNPGYIIFLVALIVVFWKKQHVILWNQMNRSGWKWFFIPVLLWLIIPVPNRVKTILSFAISRPLGSPPPSSLEYYVYYFKRIPAYFSNEWLAWIVVGISVLVMIRYHRLTAVRLAGGLFMLPLVLMTLNQNKQDRFLFTFIPALWILVAFGVSRIPRAGIRIAAALGILLISALTFDPEAVRGVVRGQFIALRSRTPLHFIAERLSEASEIRVLGATNELNPAMIQYHSGRISGFVMDQHFDWEMEERPKASMHIICIDCEAPGKPLRMRSFPGGLVVRHTFLDTPEGAPYNPDLVTPASRQ